jgi:hypothetical protein
MGLGGSIPSYLLDPSFFISLCAQTIHVLNDDLVMHVILARKASSNSILKLICYS